MGTAVVSTFWYSSKKTPGATARRFVQAEPDQDKGQTDARYFQFTA
jgi:hypothetical protein